MKFYYIPAHKLHIVLSGCKRLKNAILWDLMICGRRFGGTYHNHHKATGISELETTLTVIVTCHPEEAGDTFLQIFVP
jgi:hypothetical protein